MFKYWHLLYHNCANSLILTVYTPKTCFCDASCWWSWSSVHHWTSRPMYVSCLWCQWPARRKRWRTRPTVCGWWPTRNRVPAVSLRYRRTKVATTWSAQRFGFGLSLEILAALFLFAKLIRLSAHRHLKVLFQFSRLLENPCKFLNLQRESLRIFTLRAKLSGAVYCNRSCR